MNKIRFLKVKIKSLSAEARIIRREELRSRGELRDALHRHRVRDVRSEARATHVAYGYLRARTLAQVEPHADSAPDWKKVEGMVKKYGQAEQLTAFSAWKEIPQQIAAQIAA